IKDLVEEGRVRHGWIGVAIASVTPDLADALGLPVAQGAIVREVLKGGPAAKAGIQKGDIITKVGTETITGQEKLIQIVTGLKAGQDVPLELLRKNQKKDVMVRIEEDHGQAA